MNILVACSHTGGVNAVLPVARLLRAAGHAVEFASCGEASSNVLRQQGEEFRRCTSPDRILEGVSAAPSIYLTSMCEKALSEAVGYVRTALPDCVSIAVQALWENGLDESWPSPECQPDYIIVNDEVGKDLIAKTWKGFPQDHIMVIGFPNLDIYAGSDWKRVSQETRARLGMTETRPIVFFVGQIKHTIQDLLEVILALNTIGQRVYFVARPHPRMEQQIPGSTAQWEKALQSFKSGVLVDTSSETTEAVTASSDVVVSAYSTVLVEAALLRKETIAVLFPERGAQNFRELTGLEEFSLVALGCAAKATNPSEVSTFLRSALNSTLGLREAQEKHLRTDGRNSQRTANFIQGLA